MKILFLALILILCCNSLFAQGHENTMLFGYAGGDLSPNDDRFGINILTFTNGSLEITDNQFASAFFNDTDAAISDSNGNLLFYFNGIDVFNKEHQVMQNGGLLNKYKETGYDLPQGGIIIPWPGKPNLYILFHLDEDWFTFPDGWVVGGGTGCFYSVVDMTLNNGLGRVMQRKATIVADTVEYGKLVMTRHANGRDWWLMVPELRSNRFYTVLIDPYGIHNMGIQTVGKRREAGIGQAFFSPDGSRYVIQNAIGGWEGYYVDIYDFDRCSGMLSIHEQMHFVDTFARGVMISPNSRWLYISAGEKLFQYDLWSSPVAQSGMLIALYEDFNDPFPTLFHRGFLAPDDKIYIVTSSGSRTLHVIHKPDEAGTACAFQQPGVRLICNNNSSLPTFANYRLGPLDGSSCDTLGLNNEPKAWWRYEQDTLNALAVEFRDLSYYEPATWAWDFGDGSPASSARHPQHQYAQPGAYQVCLTVSNQYGTDTHCKTLYLGVTAQDNPVLQAQVLVWPNPFRERFAVALSANLRSPALRLYDAAGRLVLEQRLVLGVNEIEAAGLPQGLYVWEVVAGGERVKSGKCVKLAE
ncbi:MAG: PKD domain-containing protein [Saprospiraceae bacterium]|nr:PKD domain-containing protein [Saprospiraceae bacterium]